MNRQEAENADRILDLLKQQTTPLVAQDIRTALGITENEAMAAIAVIEAHDPTWIVRERVTYTRDSFMVNREMVGAMSVWKDFGGFRLAFYNQGRVAEMNADRRTFFEKHLPAGNQAPAKRPSIASRYGTLIKTLIGLILLAAAVFVYFRYKHS